MTQVVIITDRQDVHVPFVTRHLQQSPILIDPLEVLQGKDLTFTMESAEPVVYDGQALEVTAVWYRKPAGFEAATVAKYIDMEDEETDEAKLKTLSRYVTSALNNLAQSLYGSYEDAYWMSDYYRLMAGEDKARQLRLAKRLGFAVPKTIITSSPDEARAFLKAHSYCVAKPLSSWAIPGRHQYTSLVDASQDLDFDGLRVDPMIFQVGIKPAKELRVTVIEEEVFAAVVKGRRPSNKLIRDWRQSLIDDSFTAEPIELEPRLRRLYVAFVRAQGLRSGMFDSIVDDNAVPWFLECNPNGQWGFIELETGQPIGKAIARALEAGGA